MSDDYAPAQGWYDDPERALRLRWWDGARWTTHTRAKMIVETVPATGGRADMSSSDALAMPGVTQPYGYSAPYSWSPSTPSAAASASEPAEPTARGTFRNRTVHPDEIWNSSRQTMEYAPERTITAAAWALAVTPLVLTLSQLAAVALTGLGSTPLIAVIAATVLPVLWIIIWVRRDRLTLHEWGHLRLAHWAWALLGAVGYLTARTLVVRRQAAGRGWWPLLVNLALTAILLNIWLLTPLFGMARLVVY